MKTSAPIDLIPRISRLSFALCLGSIFALVLSGCSTIKRTIRGEGTWNAEFTAENVTAQDNGVTQSAHSLRLHVCVLKTNAEILILGGYIDTNKADGASKTEAEALADRQLVGADIRRMITTGGQYNRDALNAIALDYEADGRTKWKVRVFHDYTGTAGKDFLEVFLIGTFNSKADFITAQNYLGAPQTYPAGKDILKVAFRDDPAALLILRL
jgi:hypothetical protein